MGTASASDVQDVLVQVLRQDVAYLTCLEKTTLRGLRTRVVPIRQGRLRQLYTRTKKIGLYFQGVSHFSAA